MQTYPDQCKFDRQRGRWQVKKTVTFYHFLWSSLTEVWIRYKEGTKTRNVWWRRRKADKLSPVYLPTICLPDTDYGKVRENLGFISKGEIQPNNIEFFKSKNKCKFIDISQLLQLWQVQYHSLKNWRIRTTELCKNL